MPPAVIRPLPSSPCFSVTIPPFVFSSFSVSPDTSYVPNAPTALSPSQTIATACSSCDAWSGSSTRPSALLKLFYIGDSLQFLALPLPPLPCPILARIHPASQPRHVTPFAEPQTLCIMFSVLPPPLLLLSLRPSPPLPHVLLSPSRLIARLDQRLCVNVSAARGALADGAQMIGLDVRVQGGTGSTWANSSWFIPNVAVIYPVQVFVRSASVLVVGVPSFLTFHAAPHASDVLLQMQPVPAGDGSDDRHGVIFEHRLPAGAGQEGLISVACTSPGSQFLLFSLLFVAVNVQGFAGSEQVVSRATLNVTCIASSTTLHPAAASVLVGEALVVKVSVVDPAPPPVFPLFCEQGLSIVSPPSALMPLGENGFYEGVFVLKCWYAPSL